MKQVQVQVFVDVICFLCTVNIQKAKNNPTLSLSICKPLTRDLITIFPAETFAGFDWVRDPWNSCALESAADLPLQAQEQLAEMREDRTLRITFQDMALDTFWISLEKEYPILSSNAVDILLPFATTYLCELSFSSLTCIKNKYRESQ